MPLLKDPEKRARQLANLKAFEKDHAPLTGVGRSKKITDKLDMLFEQRCTNQRILDQLFLNDTPKQRSKRTHGVVLVAVAMQRATVKSDLLTRLAQERGRCERLQARPEGRAPEIGGPRRWLHVAHTLPTGDCLLRGWPGWARIGPGRACKQLRLRKSFGPCAKR
jgi:hypothetical protein